MREFLLSYCPILILLIAIIEIVMAVVFLKMYAKKKQPITLCMAVLTLGLFLDAFVIDLGSVVSGDFLAVISRMRFVSHGVLIPLLFPICAYGLKLKEKGVKIVWIFTGILMVAGLAESLALQLEVKELAGITRYVSGEGSPAWAEGISSMLSYGTVIPLIICGIIIWIKQKNPHLFLSGFLMFAFAALGPATGNFDLIFFISMFGEVLMVIFFYLYARKDVKELADT